MPASKTLSSTERVQRARLAAHESWASTANRAARTEAARSASPGSIDYWLERVDPDGTMSPEARRRAAESKRSAYMARLAYRASRARSRKAKAADDNEAA